MLLRTQEQRRLKFHDIMLNEIFRLVDVLGTYFFYFINELSEKSSYPNRKVIVTNGYAEWQTFESIYTFYLLENNFETSLSK